MAKKNDVTSVIQDMLGANEPKNTPQTPIQARHGVQNKKSDKTTTGKNEALVQHNFRMKQSDYERLQQHFDNQGLPTGAGLRMVLYKYMKEENI